MRKKQGTGTQATVRHHGIETTAIRLAKGRKSDVRTQFAALPWRIEGGKVRVCLITTTQGHWGIPKGWPMDGKSALETVEIEAFEEAGLRGRARPECLGLFSYVKPLDRSHLPCVAMVFAMEVEKEVARWPEQDRRKRKWVGRKKAAKLVEHAELARIIGAFSPGRPA